VKRLLAAVGVAGAVVVAAPVAHAGPWDDPSLTPAAQDYVNHKHNAICEALQADLSPRGVTRVVTGIERQDHFSYHDAATIVNVSVAKTCSQFMPALTAIGNLQRAGRQWHYGGGILA
jgi:hypothetical protein